MRSKPTATTQVTVSETTLTTREACKFVGHSAIGALEDEAAGQQKGGQHPAQVRYHHRCFVRHDA